jgi:hypothetical protein
MATRPKKPQTKTQATKTQAKRPAKKKVVAAKASEAAVREEPAPKTPTPVLVNSVELARDLAGAKSPMEMMRLGMNYWHEHMGVFEAQAQELRTLSAEFVTTASEPIRAHIRRT